MSLAAEVMQWLRVRGCPDHVVEDGLPGLIARWERVAEECARGYRGGLDDWLDDLDARQLLFELAQEFPAGIDEPLDARLAAADASLGSVTYTADECVWGGESARENGWAAKVEWWYWCIPLDPGEELSQELGLRGPRES